MTVISMLLTQPPEHSVPYINQPMQLALPYYVVLSTVWAEHLPKWNNNSCLSTRTSSSLLLPTFSLCHRVRDGPHQVNTATGELPQAFKYCCCMQPLFAASSCDRSCHRLLLLLPAADVTTILRSPRDAMLCCLVVPLHM